VSLAGWVAVLALAAFLALGVLVAGAALGRDSGHDAECTCDGCPPVPREAGLFTDVPPWDPPPPGPDSSCPPL